MSLSDTIAGLGNSLINLVNRKTDGLYFDNVASLKAASSLTANQIVHTKGYYSPNDGGGAKYIIRAIASGDTDDGGSILAITGGTLVAELIVENSIINIRQFGAKCDATTDDKNAIQAALNFGRTQKLTLYVDGDVRVTGTLSIDNNGGNGVSLIGKTARPTITLDSDADVPLIRIWGGSAGFSNTKVENFNLRTTNSYVNAGIKLNGCCFSYIHNIHIRNFKYGIWLSNDISTSTFTECNHITHCSIDYNTYNIYFNPGGGAASFHGNTFKHVSMNVSSNQYGFYFAPSSHWYNGEVDVKMWTHGENAYCIYCDNSNNYNITGTISVESPNDPRGIINIINNGRFWLNGIFEVYGGINIIDEAQADGENGFMAENLQAPATQTSSSTTYNLAPEYTQGNTTGGRRGLYKYSASNIRGTAIMGYSGGPSSLMGLVLGYKKNCDESVLGFLQRLASGTIQTFANALYLIDKDSNNCASIADGRFHAHNTGYRISTAVSEVLDEETELPIEQDIVVSLNSTSPTQVVLDPRSPYFLTINIAGSNFEWRRMYIAWHQGFGGNGILTEIAQGYNKGKSGVTIGTPTLADGGKLHIPINTNMDITVYCSISSPYRT